MPLLHWTSPEGDKWTVLYPSNFEGDLLFTHFDTTTPKAWKEGHTICKHILKIVKEEFPRRLDLRRKVLVLMARNIKGKPDRLYIPFDLLVEVVARGYVFPKLLRWFYAMDSDLLMAFMPLAESVFSSLEGDRFTFPRKKMNDCMESARRVFSQNSYRRKIRRKSLEKEVTDDENPQSLRRAGESESS